MHAMDVEEKTHNNAGIVASLPVVALGDPRGSNKLVDERIDDRSSKGLRKLYEADEKELKFRQRGP